MSFSVHIGRNCTSSLRSPNGSEKGVDHSRLCNGINVLMTALIPQVLRMSTDRACLQDRDPHDADSVVGQELHFDDRGPHKGQGEAANVGAHGSQPQLDPHLALQVQVADQHRQLHSQAEFSMPARRPYMSWSAFSSLAWY